MADLSVVVEILGKNKLSDPVDAAEAELLQGGVSQAAIDAAKAGGDRLLGRLLG